MRRSFLILTTVMAGCYPVAEIEANIDELDARVSAVEEQDSGMQSQLDALSDAYETNAAGYATELWVQDQSYVDTTTLDAELQDTEDRAGVQMAAAACVGNAFANENNYARVLLIEDGDTPEQTCKNESPSLGCFIYLETHTYDSRDAEISGSSGCSNVVTYTSADPDLVAYACCTY